MLMASVVSTALLKEVPSLGQCRGRWTQKVVPDGKLWSENETVKQTERFRDLGRIEAVIPWAARYQEQVRAWTRGMS